MPTVLIKASTANEIERKFEVSNGQILFDEIDRLGFVLPHGCLSGSCGSCRIEILEGSHNLSEMGSVEKDTVESIKKTYSSSSSDGNKGNKNIRLSCRVKVLGDIQIAVLK